METYYGHFCTMYYVRQLATSRGATGNGTNPRFEQIHGPVVGSTRRTNHCVVVGGLGVESNWWTVAPSR